MVAGDKKKIWPFTVLIPHPLYCSAFCVCVCWISSVYPRKDHVQFKGKGLEFKIAARHSIQHMADISTLDKERKCVCAHSRVCKIRSY